jgi:hypothetical protein
MTEAEILEELRHNGVERKDRRRVGSIGWETVWIRRTQWHNRLWAPATANRRSPPVPRLRLKFSSCYGKRSKRGDKKTLLGELGGENEKDFEFSLGCGESRGWRN